MHAKYREFKWIKIVYFVWLAYVFYFVNSYIQKHFTFCHSHWVGQLSSGLKTRGKADRGMQQWVLQTGDEEVDEAVFKQLEEAFCLQVLVILGEFTLLMPSEEAMSKGPKHSKKFKMSVVWIKLPVIANISILLFTVIHMFL